jgi:hypothetical protein
MAQILNVNLRRQIVKFLKIFNSFRLAVCQAASDRTTVLVVALLDYFVSSLLSCGFAYNDVTNANQSRVLDSNLVIRQLFMH